MMTLLQVMPDEPLISPVTPGAALCRLSEVLGALARQNALSDWVEALRAARNELSGALEQGVPDGLANALRAAQEKLSACYSHVCTLDEAAALCAVAGFPAPGKVAPSARFIGSVDPSTVQVSFTCFGKQVLTSFAFRDAPGATAYWLHEVRYIDNERSEWARLEDPLVESYTPLFARVRLGAGTRHFRIEARNPHTSVISDEFTVEVPSLT